MEQPRIGYPKLGMPGAGISFFAQASVRHGKEDEDVMDPTKIRQLGYPRLGTPAAQAFANAGVTLVEQPALPELTEPTMPTVDRPIDERLILVDHPRVQVVPFYELGGWEHAISQCWLRESVAGRLYEAVDSLPEPYGFAVYDGWRPRELQAELYYTAIADPALPPGFMSEPSHDEARPAPHESGGAVDLTLTIGGVAIAPGTDFDDITTRAFALSIEDEPGPDREARRLLYRAMHHAGFVVFRGEWWHFEYGTRRWSGITGEPPIYGATTPMVD